MIELNKPKNNMTMSKIDTLNDTAYNAAAQYRHQLAMILADAVDMFKDKVVTWAHAGIFATEMKSVAVPSEPGPKYGEILEEALQELRGLVTVK